MEWQPHLSEFRKRLTMIIGVVAILFFSLLGFANKIYHVLAQPLLGVLPNHGEMIATSITSPLFVPIRFVFFLSIFLAIPWMLYQLWAFIAPGLHQHEKKIIWFIAVASSVLFYAGIFFAYEIVFPLLFRFFVSVTPVGVRFMPDIGQYLDFIFSLFLAFGCAFEVPVLIVLLVRFNILTINTLQKKRPYIIVGCFVLGMLLTPPDVLSQILLAIPMWLLFEFGLLIAKYIKKDSLIVITNKN